MDLYYYTWFPITAWKLAYRIPLYTGLCEPQVDVLTGVIQFSRKMSTMGLGENSFQNNYLFNEVPFNYASSTPSRIHLTSPFVHIYIVLS